jgi:hypothetical protein
MLSYMLVLLIAAGVGWGVYWLTLRYAETHQPDVPEDVNEWTETRPSPDDGGFVPEPDVPMFPGGGAYVPVTQGRPSWQSRLSGVLGLAIAVTVAAISAAFALYSLGHLVARLLQSASSG